MTRADLSNTVRLSPKTEVKTFDLLLITTDYAD